MLSDSCASNWVGQGLFCIMENDSEAVHEPLFQVEYMMDRLGQVYNWDFVLNFRIVVMVSIPHKGAMMLFNVFVWRAKSQRGR